MTFSLDFIISTEDAPGMLLIVEAKLSSRNRSEDEAQLKFYMWQMSCPVGLFITPDEIVVYRDSYTSLSEESVRQISAFPAPKDWAIFKPPLQDTGNASAMKADLALRFEEKVRSWLEDLRSSPSNDLPELPRETREALVDYVVPALSQGVVRGGGPRQVRTESD
jgi:hypothetical protein